MATATQEHIREAYGDQCVELRDIDWKGYSTLLRLRGEHSRPRIIYLDGTVWLMSPRLIHERLKKWLGWLVEVIVEELDMPCIAAAATTLRRWRKRGGVEGDQSYYLANEARVRGKKKVNLKTDPPPDLAIEAVYSQDADAAIEVYRRFKVPEVWVSYEAEVAILVLGRRGRYVRSPQSLAFPFLAAVEAFDWVSRPQTVSDTQWVTELRRWVKETLVRRAGPAAAGLRMEEPRKGPNGGRQVI
ncbi:MAG: Uma2 family endonuclease [Isosphaeraceae bacterium]